MTGGTQTGAKDNTQAPGQPNNQKDPRIKLPAALQQRIDALDDPSQAPDDSTALTPSTERTAVALSYEIGGENLPKVVATGRGQLAEDIVRLAFEAGVKVREDRDLAQLLVSLDLDSEIPTEALEAVAEILSYVYKANGKMTEMKEAAAAANKAADEAEAADAANAALDEKPLASPMNPTAGNTTPDQSGGTDKNRGAGPSKSDDNLA